MKTYISILRGINVNGQKKILMQDLTELYQDLDFKEVVTYIQSGNVIFKTEKKFTDIKLAKLIEEKIAEKYNFHVPIIIRTYEDLQNVVLTNPFKNEDIDSLYVTFLSNTPNALNLMKLDDANFLPDKFEVIGKEIFICVTSYGNTKLSNNFFESKLKVIATTRNWKTVNKLIEIVKV